MATSMTVARTPPRSLIKQFKMPAPNLRLPTLYRLLTLLSATAELSREITNAFSALTFLIHLACSKRILKSSTARDPTFKT